MDDQATSIWQELFRALINCWLVGNFAIILYLFSDVGLIVEDYPVIIGLAIIYFPVLVIDVLFARWRRWFDLAVWHLTLILVAVTMIIIDAPLVIRVYLSQSAMKEYLDKPVGTYKRPGWVGLYRPISVSNRPDGSLLIHTSTNFKNDQGLEFWPNGPPDAKPNRTHLFGGWWKNSFI